MNVRKFFNPVHIFIHLWQYRELIKQLALREITARYRGSFIGLGWSFIQPLMMLCVYTFVFSVIFKSKWGVSPDESRAAFALALFMGLITFGLFSEVLNGSPSLVISNQNYVKKVVFPLEILPFVRLLSTFVNSLISLSVLIIGILIIKHFLHWTILLLPFVWFSMMLFTLGCGYFLASIGVFIRDVEVTTGILTTILFFLTPIFYPISAVPERFRFISHMNPVAIFVEDSRRVVLWGLSPDWPLFFIGLGVSTLTFILGFIWFIKTKKAFADVI
ncbi:Putative ABC-type transport system, ATP-binding protein [Desulfonema limicola]|uniref:Transport permease protein n=1 Tax=Desulfonema limicola TaxID=45656 RepID=A0A975B815_9BACT|nr:ABC transporter permease [Desulfonema limicola]QTA80408.1 Putative ABC-type transport system, ATP-binding protein [Desulfonema limicola]